MFLSILSRQAGYTGKVMTKSQGSVGSGSRDYLALTLFNGPEFLGVPRGATAAGSQGTLIRDSSDRTSSRDIFSIITPSGTLQTDNRPARNVKN